MTPSGCIEGEKELVDRFFLVKVPQVLSNNSFTEASCHEFGKNILNMDDLRYVENQGCNSFTLVSLQASTIVQFRLKAFDMDLLDLAHRVHGSLVPRPVLHPGFPLPVYTCPVLPGRVHIYQDFPEDLKQFPLQRQLNTVRDAAAFIARSASCPPHDSAENTEWLTRAELKLARLARNGSLLTLAPVLHSAILELQRNLPLLADTLPWVLTHVDFAEVNILVDQDGHITGVLDYDDAVFRPFGTCIWGVYESFLGSMENMKWAFFDQTANEALGDEPASPGLSVRQVLESAFWQELIQRVTAEGLDLDEQVEVAMRTAACLGAVERYLDCGLLDHIDIETSNHHRRSLEFAKGVIPAMMPIE